MTTESEDHGPEAALRSTITTCVVRAFGELAQNGFDALCSRLRLLDGCPERLPCPACSAQMKSPTPMGWAVCTACGARSQLLIYFAGGDGTPWMPRYALARKQAQQGVEART